MPLLNIYASVEPQSPETSTRLLNELSSTLARMLHKPEQYVMTCLMPKTTITFGGSVEPACYAELKNIGEFSPEDTLALSAELCTTLSRALGVPKNRIYIEFTNAKSHLWGYDGETFA